MPVTTYGNTRATQTPTQNDAYRRGFSDFLYGIPQPARITVLQEAELVRRLTAVRSGNLPLANKLRAKLERQGLILTDLKEELGTVVEYLSQPDNPYRPGTVFSKEWERGQNAAYFSNLKRITP